MKITRYSNILNEMRESWSGDYVLHADAQAALTAIERAAYERGVRDTLAAADREAKGKVHIGGQAFRTVKLDDLEPAALALLTQEGR